MTDLKRSVKRVTVGRIFPRPIVIELEPPNLIRLREKGRRYTVETTSEALYFILVEKEVAHRKREKKVHRWSGRAKSSRR